MSDGPLNKSEFFEALSSGLQESTYRRGRSTPDIDDLLHALASYKGGTAVAQTRTLDAKSLIGDIEYVQFMGRPTGYERPNLQSALKHAFTELMPRVTSDFQRSMNEALTQLDPEYGHYRGEVLEHAEQQYARAAIGEFDAETPLTLHGIARYLIQRVLVSQQQLKRAETGVDEPLQPSGKDNSQMAHNFGLLTDNPITLLKALTGDQGQINVLRTRRFVQAIDPAFSRLILNRNNNQLAHSSAVPESDMPATDLVKFVSGAKDEATLVGDKIIEPRHLFLAMLEDDQVKAEISAMNHSARRVNVAEIRMALMTSDVSEADDTIPEASPAFRQALAQVRPEFETPNSKHSASRAVQKLIESQSEIRDALLSVGFTERRLERWASLSGTDLPADKPAAYKITDDVFNKAIDAYTRDITDMAKRGKLDPVIGREDELDQMKVIMTHRKKKNPIVIGEPGVGKTALLHGYAQDVVNGNVPDNQQGARVLELDLQALIAGTQYRGEFEERLKNIIQGIAERNERGDRPPIILGIDEAHAIVGLGNAKGAPQGADQYLKPALQEGNLWTIMFTTEDEYTKHIEKDGALARRTQTLKVNEPSPDDTVTILKGLKGKYEDHYDLTITDGAIEAIVELGGRYIHDRHFPDKGIDILDGAGAIAMRDGKTTIDRDAIVGVVARMAKLKPEYLNQEDNQRYAELADRLKGDVFGQDPAVDEVALSLAVAKAGLREPNKPIGSYLFVGPTGVGKTELTKSLAKHTSGSEDNIVRLNMSEYMEKHSVSKLIGAPPGYVGHGEEGELTGAVRRNPNAVVLLDEVEKAHPDVLNVLLQVMDEGRLKDSRGREIDFSNTMLVMTSNLGAAAANAEAKRNPIGFHSEATEQKVDRAGVMSKAVEGHFSPEFRNRLDGVVQFHELTRDVMEPILDRQIKRLGHQMEASWGIKLSIDPAAKETLLTEGFDPEMGARPLKRALNQLVERPLAMWLLKNKDMRDRPGSTVTVEAVGKDFKIREDGGNDLVINPNRIVGPPHDLPGDALARLMARREQRKRPAPAPAPGQRRFG